MSPGLRLQLHPAKLEKRGRDQVVGWVEHLVLCACRQEGIPPRTLLVGLDRAYEFQPVTDPLAHLERLLDLYGEGLTVPLPLLPTASLAYAEAVSRGKDEVFALDAAREAWEGGYRRRGDGEDGDLQACYRRSDPITGRFQDVALIVYEPLLRHREKG